MPYQTGKSRIKVGSQEWEESLISFIIIISLLLVLLLILKYIKWGIRRKLHSIDTYRFASFGRTSKKNIASFLIFMRESSRGNKITAECSLIQLRNRPKQTQP